MHSHTTDGLSHTHVFLGEKHRSHERRTWAVVALTAGMMVVEVGGGSLFGSMALIADGWHMSTHVLALGIAALAYRFARHHAHDARFTFGTGKLGDLAAFTSAIILAMIALYVGAESLRRLLNPTEIAFSEAIPIAVVGLVVNLASVWLLHGDDHDHHGSHDRGAVGSNHGHGHRHHHDSNMRAAYVHVLADALTSVLAIFALLGGRFFGLRWLDPAIGLFGTLVIAAWAISLVKSAGSVLLDVTPDAETATLIRQRLETDGDIVTDLHLWQVGPGHQSAIISIVSDAPQSPALYKRRLADLPNISHLTVEVETCPNHAAV